MNQAVRRALGALLLLLSGYVALFTSIDRHHATFDGAIFFAGCVLGVLIARVVTPARRKRLTGAAAAVGALIGGWALLVVALAGRGWAMDLMLAQLWGGVPLLTIFMPVAMALLCHRPRASPAAAGGQ